MTENEVLALAEKIKQQRKIDTEYIKARVALKELKRDINNDTKKISNKVRVSFGTTKPFSGYNSVVDVDLPLEAAGDLMQFLHNYIAEKDL